MGRYLHDIRTEGGGLKRDNSADRLTELDSDWVWNPGKIVDVINVIVPVIWICLIRENVKFVQ